MASTLQSPRVRTEPTVTQRRPRAAAEPALRDATMLSRIGGAVIDAVLLVVVCGVVSSIVMHSEAGTTQMRFDPDTGEHWVVQSGTQPHWALALLPFVLTAVYTIVPMALWGRTAGGWCLGIKCVSMSGAARPGFALAARRWALLYGAAGLLAFLPLLGAITWLIPLVIGLSPLWDRNRRMQGHQDLWAGDRVVSMRQGARAS